MKCDSSCWSPAPSWSTEACDSQKVPVAHWMGKVGPSTERTCLRSEAELCQELAKLVWYRWVGKGAGTVSWATSITSPGGSSLRVRTMRPCWPDRCQWGDKMRSQCALQSPHSRCCFPKLPDSPSQIFYKNKSVYLQSNTPWWEESARTPHRVRIPSSHAASPLEVLAAASVPVPWLRFGLQWQEDS